MTTSAFLFAMPPRFLKLNMPTCNHFRLACATSTSFRLGQQYVLMNALLPVNSKVLNTLISKCSHVFVRFAAPHSPFWMEP